MRKCHFVLAVVLCLFIVPLIFAPYYASPTTPTQQKTTKEFATSAYLDESDDSIKLFRETLEDNVFFTPDGFYDDTPVYPNDGNDDWADCLELDGSRWSVHTDPEYLLFSSAYSIEGFEYSFYGLGAGGGGNLSVFDTMAQEWYILEEITSGVEQWYNGTYWGANYEPDRVFFWSENNVGSISLDYIELRFHYAPLYDYSYATGYTHYAESFTNVSDWTQELGTITTDGDIATISNTWSKRQNVAITGSSGAGSNYQLKLIVTYDDDMQADFDDLRFYDNDCITELDYWIESYTASTTATVWVEVKDSLDSNANIFMYYGNSAVSTTSDGEATFLLFDDFNTLDGDKWNSSGASVSAGILEIAIGIEYIRSIDMFNSSTALEARTKQAGNRKHNYGYGANIPFAGAQWIHHAQDGITRMYEGNDDTGTKTYASDTFLIESIYWKDADEGEYDIDRTGREDRDDTDIPDNNCYVGAQTWGTSDTSFFIDWLFVRNWIETEPSVATWGDEEESPARSYESFSSTNYFEYYYEFYVSSTTAPYNFQFYYGSSWVNVTSAVSTEGTISGIISDSNANVTTRFSFLVAGELVIDYLRISPADERGWQYDGSTTEGITEEVSIGCGVVLSSDGDILTIETEKTGGVDTHYYIEIDSDSTTTHSELEYDYYPFFKLRYRITESTNARLHIYINFDDTLILNQDHSENETTDWITLTYNLVGGQADNVDYNLRFYQVVSDAADIGTLTIEVDFAKVYSIANFTVTQDATTPIDHYLYVNPAGVLYRVGSSASQYNITLAHDPAVSIAQATYNQWNMDTTGSASGRIDYGLQLYNGSDWFTYYNETSGSVPTGTITDFALITTNAYSFSSITFVDMHRWHDVDEKVLYFVVANWYLIGSAILIFWSDVSTLALDMILIMGGLILIPCSTLYLVKGGKDGLSSDKFFYFCIAFIMGWALFIGGIM